jgi:PAS domain S-box-containing protein
MPRTLRPTGAPGTEELSSILDRVALPVWVVDHLGLVIFVNPAGLAALGYDDLSELIGRPGHDTIHYKRPDGSPYPAEECAMVQARGTGETVRCDEEWLVRRDGSMVPVSYTMTPLDLGGGQGAVVTFQDLGEQREAEQAVREREAMLASIDQPVWALAPDGRFHYVNEAAATVLGYDDPAELIGRPGHETVHHKRPDGSPYPVEECPIAHALEHGETLHQHDDCLVRKDGSMVEVTYSMRPFPLPDGLGAITAFIDMEERRAAERTARERDVAEARAEELRAARRRVIEAGDAARARLERDLHDGAQQDFVSAVLNLRLADRLEAKDPVRARELRAQGIELADTGVAELRRLAAGIHPAVLTDHGLGPAIEALAARLPIPVCVEDSAQRRLPAPVEASVYFFVSEALTNTVKHAQANEARVRLAADDGELTVEVADDGIGGAEAGVGGTGLRGLDDRICALDGALELRSPPDGGTRLRARIPLAP